MAPPRLVPLGLALVLTSPLALAQTTPSLPPPPPPPELQSPPPATMAAPAAPAEPAPADVPTAAGGLVRVTLQDGQVLRGKLLEARPDALVLEIAGGRLEVPQMLVKDVETERAATLRPGGLAFADPNSTRYLYGPSGFMLRRGQAYFSQKELVFSSFGYGVTDNFSVLAGTVVPAWFLGTEGMNAIVGLKGGGDVNEWLHLAGGLEALLLPGVTVSSNGSGPTVIGVGFGTATVGSRDRNLSLSLGKAFAAGVSDPLGPWIIAVSGNLRVSPLVALLTENWILPPFGSNSDFFVLDSFAVRILGERFAADIGGIWMFTQNGLLTAVPIPWLDFTYNFEL